MGQWQRMTAQAVLQELDGKTAVKGQNVIFPEKKKTPLTYLAPILLSPLLLVFVLSAFAAFVAEELFLGYLASSAFLFFTVAFYFAYRRSLEIMENSRRLTGGYARVVRDGQLVLVIHEDLVKGDILLFQAGDYIPADCRVLAAYDCRVRENALFHEKSRTVLKTAAPSLAAYEEADNMLWAGTVIESGSCRAVVCEIGTLTRLSSLGENGSGELMQKSNYHAYLKKLSFWASSILLGILFLTVIFSFTPLSEKGLFADWMLMATLAGTAMTESLTVIAAVAYGNAVKKSRSFHARHPERLQTLSEVDHVILSFDSFRKPALDGVHTLLLPDSDGVCRSEAVSPTLSSAGRRVLRNAFSALGGFKTVSEGDVAFSSGVTLAEGLARACRKASLSFEEDDDAPISSATFADGVSYGLFYRNETVFVSLTAPCDMLLPLCAFLYGDGKILPLTDAARKSLVEAISAEGLNEVFGVAVGVLETMPSVLPFEEEELLSILFDRLAYAGAAIMTRATVEVKETLSAFEKRKIALTIMLKNEKEAAFLESFGKEMTPLLSPSRKELFDYIRFHKDRGETILFEAREATDLALMKEAALSFVRGDMPTDGQTPLREVTCTVGDGREELLASGPSAVRLYADYLLSSSADALANATVQASLAFSRMSSVLCYLASLLPIKLILAIATLFASELWLSPVLLLFLGFGFDTLAVFALLLQKGTREERPPCEADVTRMLAVRLTVSAALGLLVLTALLLAVFVFSLMGEDFCTATLFGLSYVLFLCRYLSTRTRTVSPTLTLGKLLAACGAGIFLLLLFTRDRFGLFGFLSLFVLLALTALSELFVRLVLKKLEKRCKKLQKTLDKEEKV